jgi:hypothetical protein
MTLKEERRKVPGLIVVVAGPEANAQSAWAEELLPKPGARIVIVVMCIMWRNVHFKVQVGSPKWRAGVGVHNQGNE